jgi:hypothetical protein
MAFFNYAYIIYIVIPIFFVIMNLTYILIWRKNSFYAHAITFAMMMILTTWALFSWWEGPWAEVRYLTRKYGMHWENKHDVNLIKKWLLITRIVKASFVIPIESISCVGIIFALKNKLNEFNYSW